MMKTKLYMLQMLMAALLVSFCKGQNTNADENKDTTYLLGDYLINPAKKLVSVYEMVGGMRGNMVWDGFRYAPDSTINYDSTTLFIVGNRIFFKEHINDVFRRYNAIDFNTLRVIRVDLKKWNNGNDAFICRDKNYLHQNIYYMDDTINISAYKPINDYIYQKDSNLYFLQAGYNFKLKKIEGITLDTATLKHITDNYFTDKNGLYLLGAKYDTSMQLEKSDGKIIIPVVKKNYFIYGDKVYSLSFGKDTKPLTLNVSRMKELEIYSYNKACFLADDNHTFITKPQGGYSTREYDIQWSFNSEYKNDFFKKDVNQWQVIATGNIYFIQENGGTTLYFPSAIKVSGREDNERWTLIKKRNRFYRFGNSSSTLKEINQVFIFNFDTKKYEALDASQYRCLSESLSIYKNRVYGLDGLPVKEPIDAANLHFITLHDVKTNYLTDGKSLIYIGRMGGYTMDGEGGKTMQVLGRRIISGVDFSTLKVISSDILMDKEHIYNGDFDGIGVIPIKALHLKVKIFTEEDTL